MNNEIDWSNGVPPILLKKQLGKPVELYIKSLGTLRGYEKIRAAET